MGLRTYNRKRDFKKTAEPKGKRAVSGRSIFVVQKHDASHLHYDFRLELGGSLKSWAVPKGPSLDPGQKRLAMQVEDHPLEYAKFEGIIPKGEYGGGEVIVWDYGVWKPVGDAKKGYRSGRLEFELRGKKLRGRWVLVRTRPSGERSQWLLIKRHDEVSAGPKDLPITESRPESARTGKLLTRDQLALGAGAARSVAKRANVWSSDRSGKRSAKPPIRKAAKKPTRKRKPLAPQLATLVDAPPGGERWIHEIKYDGYRTFCRIDADAAVDPVFTTRTGLDWSEKYAGLGAGVRGLAKKGAILDGEIVALDEEGRSDFGRLQKALKEGADDRLVYFVFDLLELDGRNLRKLPLIERKEILRKLLAESDDERVRYSDHWEGVADDLLRKVCELELEGVISKDKFARYSPGRSRLWVKSKCIQGQEVVIAGYTAPEGSRAGFGSLVLAAYEKNGRLRHLGRVGTGFNRKNIAEVLAALRPLETDRSPFANRVPAQNRIQWVRPKKVAEIFFHGWTPDGHVRQAVFRALRNDKPAAQVTVDYAVPSRKLPREESRAERKLEAEIVETKQEKPMAKKKGKSSKAKVSDVKLTHPEKVLIPDGKITKQQIRDYLVEISDWILPHVQDRPLALVRCPDDVQHGCFFQKNLVHPGNGTLKGVAIQDPKGKPASVIYIEDTAGLETLAQMGTIEIHAWGTHRERPRKPDLLVFDLDPGEGVKWNAVADAALRLREILDRLGLESFLKVSGNKGLHIHVPIEPGPDWEAAKSFCGAIARLMAEESPELYVATMTKAKRKGKIFIDYFRNGYGATSVVPYSLRTKNGGAIAAPIAWSEIRKIDPKGFPIRKLRARLRTRRPGGRGDPWKDYFEIRQSLPDLVAKRSRGSSELMDSAR